jgi:peptidoglycan/LPS O-acetylase OafA/YrhL
MGTAVTAQTTERPRAAHRADIQGLRGLAVLLVVGFHVRGWIPGGYLGVDVFFVISGFVITSMLGRQVAGAGSVPIGGFFARRIRRLLPMLAVTLVATPLLGILLLSPLAALGVTARTGAAAALFNANTFLARQPADYFAVPVEENALLHTWSLSVEEQFYLVVPLVVAAALWYRSRGRRPSRTDVALGLGVVLAGSFAIYAVAAAGGLAGMSQALGVSSPAALAFYSPFTRAWEFLAGAALSLGAHRVARWPRSVRVVMGVVGLLVVVASAVVIGAQQGAEGAATALPVLGTVGVLAAGIGGATTVSALLSHRWLVLLGDVSYGWYLFHWPLIVFAEANLRSTWWVLAAAVASLGLAVLARDAIENRFRYGGWNGRRLVALTAVCVLAPIVASAAAIATTQLLPVQELTDASRRHVDADRCDRRRVDLMALDDATCTWTVEDPRGRILLLGDSHAGMWSEGVIRAGNDLGYDVSIATMSGCPLVSGTLRRSADGEDARCQEFIERTVSEIERIDPSLVVVGTASTGVLDDPVGVQADDWLTADGRWTDDPGEVAELWASGLGATVASIAEAGVPMAILHDVPYQQVAPISCTRLLAMLGPSRCVPDLEVEEYLRQRSVGLEIEQQIAANSPLIHTVDPLAWLCDDERCPAHADGSWRYRDRDHLSVAGVEALADQLRNAFSGLAR